MSPEALFSLCAFFGLLWPWVMTALHRKFAENALRRILAEVLESSPVPGQRRAS